MYYGEYDFKSAKNILSQSSLFGDSSLLVIKSDTKIAQSQLIDLILQAEKSGSNYLLLEFYKNPNKKSSEYYYMTQDQAKEFDSAYSFYVPFQRDAVQMLKARSLELGLDMSEYLLSQLYTVHNGEIGICMMELEKFIIYKEEGKNLEVDAKMLSSLCFGLGAENFEEQVIALLQKKEVLQSFIKMSEEGIDEIEILNNISYFIHKLFMFYSYIRANGNPNAYEITGSNMPKFMLEKLSNLSMRFDEYQYQFFFEILSNSMLDMKLKGKIDKNSYFISTLIKLQEII